MLREHKSDSLEPKLSKTNYCKTNLFGMDFNYDDMDMWGFWMTLNNMMFRSLTEICLIFIYNINVINRWEIDENPHKIQS